jgi:hypothetical protein
MKEDVSTNVNNKMQKHRNITLERFDKFISTIYFVDSNLFGLTYPKNKKEKVDLQVYEVKGIGPIDKRISYDEAMKGEFKKTEVIYLI